MESHVIRLFREADAFFFDLDGCIYRGDQICAGALPLLGWLRGANKRIRFLTNNSTETPEEVAAKLVRMGIKATAAQCRTAGEYVGHCVLAAYGASTVKVVGTASLAAMTAQAGHRVLPLDADERTDVVVIGRDPAFTYDKLKRAAAEVAGGAKLVAANPDLSHPGIHGEPVPETGALAAAVEAVSGRKALYVGKPYAGFFRYALEKDGLDPERCVMIGDNYTTDIAGGIAAGMHTIWLYGNERPDSGRAAEPDAAVPDLERLWQLLAGGGAAHGV